MNKFLTDGRKVAVIGKLNNAEYIVQEIFVTASGEEIPSGENFTTRSIHDAPLESWHTKEVARQKAFVERAQGELESINKKIKEKNSLLKAKADMLANSPELKDLFGIKSKTIAMFMTGTIKYLVIDSYEIVPPVSMEDEIISWESTWSDRSYESIKLCSILGRSKGDIEYNIHSYSDGSGSATRVWPCETLDEAKETIHTLASARINANRLSMKEYEVCKQIGIKFSEEELEKFFVYQSKNLSESISHIDASMAKESTRKSVMEGKLSSLKEYVFSDDHQSRESVGS